MPKELATIGYEGADINDFLATLAKAGVERVIDIRELPISRRKGFAKRALSSALEKAGIEYFHLKELGDPKPGRDAARNGDFATFRRIFSAHLEAQETKQALNEALKLSAESKSCLLCYERDPHYCHRMMVASVMSDLDEFEIVHLGVAPGISKDEKRRH